MAPPILTRIKNLIPLEINTINKEQIEHDENLKDIVNYNDTNIDNNNNESIISNPYVKLGKEEYGESAIFPPDNTGINNKEIVSLNGSVKLRKIFCL